MPAAEPSHDALQAAIPRKVRHRPAGTEDMKGRYPLNVEPPGQEGILVDIDLYDGPLPSQSLCCSMHRRCKVSAMRSPRRPELSQDRPRVGGHERVEAPVRQGNRMGIKRWEGSPAVATSPRCALLRGRDSVGGPAGGASDEVRIS